MKPAKLMLIPLAVLAVGSIVAGWPFLPLFAGSGVEEFFRDSLKFGAANSVLEEMEHLPLLTSLCCRR